MSEKEITLSHNGYEIKLNITNDYNESIEAIKKKLYFQNEDMEKYSLYYYDDEGDEVDVDEDQFEDAYGSSKWGLRKQEVEEPTPQVNISEIKDKIQDNAQKDINAIINKIKKDLMNKFTKISNEKISANNLKYEEKIKKLEKIIKSLKEKNKQIVETMKKSHEESVNSILNTVSEFAQNEMVNHMSILNTNFTKDLNNGIQICNNQTQKTIEEIKSKINEVNTQQEAMKQSIELSKDKFKEIYNISKNIK